MKRKVIKQRDSYTITLPMKWVKANHLEESPEIEVGEEADRLLIESLGKTKPKKTATISLDSDYALFISHVITNAYRAGYDMLRLEIKNKSQIDTVQKVLDRLLLGYEITKEEKDYCVVESISEPSNEKLEVILRRIFLIIKSTIVSFHAHLAGNEKMDIATLKANSEKVDKYCYFSRRSISKQHYTDKSHFQWLLYSNLLLMQHALKRMILYSIQSKKKISPPLASLIGYLEPYFTTFYEAYFQKDLKKLAEVNIQGEKMLYRDIYHLLEQKKEGVTLYHLGEFVRLVLISGSPVVGSLLEYSEERIS